MAPIAVLSLRQNVAAPRLPADPVPPDGGSILVLDSRVDGERWQTSGGDRVAEPQLNLLLNRSRGQRLVFGLGYRAVGSASLLGEALNGLSGSVASQIGGGK